MTTAMKVVFAGCILSSLVAMLYIGQSYYWQDSSILPAFMRHAGAGSRPHFKRVQRVGSYSCDSILTGVMVDRVGVIANLTTSIRTELLFSFSPMAEDNFKQTLVDPNHEQTVFANSPAMIWDGEKFVVVLRMWLDKEVTKDKVKNVLSDNYFFIMHFDDRMRSVDKGGRVLGIPHAVSRDVGDGPIEPRAFFHHNTLHLSFNSGAFVGNKFVDTTFFWNLETERLIVPEISSQYLLNQPGRKWDVLRDKHWSPFMWREQLYFIYSPDPLRILTCQRNSVCRYFYTQADHSYTFSDTVDCLRGGTPTLHYKDDYFITIFHVTLFRADEGFEWKRYYTFNLAVMKMGVQPRIVYLSGPIQVNATLMNSIPIARYMYIKDPFFFPVSLLLEDTNNIVIGGHINDHSSYLFRLTGLENLMGSVMASRLPTRSPSIGSLNGLAKKLAANFSGYKFM